MEISPHDPVTSTQVELTNNYYNDNSNMSNFEGLRLLSIGIGRHGIGRGVLNDFAMCQIGYGSSLF